MRKGLLAFVSLLAIQTVHAQSLFDEAVDCIKRYEGLHKPEHHPYVGYGHKLMPGERFPMNMSEQGADSLLRVDLRRKCKVFRGFGADSLLLGVLAYNVGETRVLKSQLVQKLRAGCRDIYHEYITFRMMNGKISHTLQRRRKEEFKLLFNKK